MNALPDDIRTLLTAIRDTLDLPFPDSYGDANERAYTRLLERRTQHLRAMLGAVLKTDGLSIGGVEQLIRNIATETPVTYRTAAPATEDGPRPVELTAARPCRTPWAHLPHDGCAGISAVTPATEGGEDRG